MRRCMERKDAMDGDMKLSWTQMGARRARCDVRIKKICGSCRGMGATRHTVQLYLNGSNACHTIGIRLWVYVVREWLKVRLI